MDRGARGCSWPVSGSWSRGWFVVAKESGTTERRKTAWQGRVQRIERDGSRKDKRGKTGIRPCFCRKAACLLQPVLAPRVGPRAKGKDIASLCARATFPSFIYLCLRRLYSLVFSVRCSIISSWNGLQFTLVPDARFDALRTNRVWTVVRSWREGKCKPFLITSGRNSHSALVKLDLW